MSIDTFINHLANTNIPANVFNPYSQSYQENEVRRQNLSLYLHAMVQKRPFALLVGEAPGYRGCRLTGIPFTSPHLIQTTKFTQQVSIQTPTFSQNLEWLHIKREASATIVWDFLITLPHLPLLWNAFPFHPHKPDTPQSNRPPKKSELALGRPFLIQLLSLFPITQIVAVGNKADAALTDWDLTHLKVRHPSHGGKKQFIQELTNIFM